MKQQIETKREAPLLLRYSEDLDDEPVEAMIYDDALDLNLVESESGRQIAVAVLGPDRTQTFTKADGDPSDQD